MPRKKETPSAPGWLCAGCGRSFGRANQSHVCEPELHADDWFASRPPELRAIHDAVLRYLRTLGPVVSEVVSVGILFKRARTFAELRPKKNCFALSMLLSAPIEDPRIARVIKTSANRSAYFVDVHHAREIDRDVKRWLREAYFGSQP
jgi:hypothetical protein